MGRGGGRRAGDGCEGARGRGKGGAGLATRLARPRGPSGTPAFACCCSPAWPQPPHRPVPHVAATEDYETLLSLAAAGSDLNRGLVRGGGFAFDVDPSTGARRLLGEGRFGRVYAGHSAQGEELAVKCIGAPESGVNPLHRSCSVGGRVAPGAAARPGGRGFVGGVEGMGGVEARGVWGPLFPGCRQPDAS